MASYNWIQVHRFGNDVAVFLGDGETKYLSQNDAQGLVRALNAAITDIAEQTFASSKFGTYSVQLRTDRFKEM